MKKLLFLFILILLPMLASAQTVSNVQNSGCLNKTRGEDSQIVPTIVLTKEDSTLSVQLLNYESNCGTTDFNVTHIINNESGYWFMVVLVDPVIPAEKDCECPFNVSFTIHDLKTNSFYFNCWWWDGQVELTEGESMVMAIIDDVCYNLLPSVNEAEVIKCSNYYNMSKMKIPEKVVHNGTEYRVTRIKKSAFSGCRNLTSVTIPNSVRTIGENAFANCSNLTSVKIPNSVTSISSYAFYNCTKLTSIAIPQNVTKIYDSAFRDCNSLTSITISNTVTEIGDGAFSGCSGLKSIVVEKGNTIYDSRNGCNAIIKTSDNELMVGCMKTTIPNSVTTISNFAFYKCTELTSIAIPQSVTKIGSYAFEGCTSLPSVTIPNSVTEIGVHAFYGCKNLSSITIPYGVTTIEVSTFAGCRSLTSFIIPNSVTTIKEAAFNACEGLTSITIPNSVISIGSFSFSGCESLTSITIPNSVTEIGDDAFSYCRGLTSITIPNSVTEIGNNAFRGCSGLTSVVIPNSITSINYNTFEDCSSLVSVIIPNSVTEIGGSAFQDCSGLTSVTIPNSVTEISSWTFYGCSGLISVTIGNKVDSIGYGAFAGCKKLSDVYCYTKNVPKTKNNSFENVNIEEAMLHVPAASVVAYQAVEPWCNFKGIVALPTQKVDVKINETTFPDSNFRNWVLSQEYGTDGILTDEELKNVTDIDVRRMGISNLKGIEYFTALKALNCMTNSLTTLDLSQNTVLERLDCVGNRLTTINLLENKKLRYINCSGSNPGNQLTTLDISECTELDTLGCSGNPLKTLDVSKNTKLICLVCYDNQLTSLDLSKNTALRRLHCNNNQLTTLDLSKNTQLALLQCSYNLLTTLDVTKNTALTDLTCANNKLTTLSVSNNKSLEWIICQDNKLTSLDVSGCSALTHLSCSGNQLTTLNLSGCSELESLGCGGNQLATLCLSGCSALKNVQCQGNHLTTLDLSENTALTTLYCYQNLIKGTGMDALVESLPIVSEGSLNVMYFENEQNVITTTQVAAAKAKGWTSYICIYDHSKEYAGSDTMDDYCPFVEEGKVWKVGHVQTILDNSVNVVDYYYFDGDTIIDGKTCKQMMCQRYVSPDYSNEYGTPTPSLTKVGAWYEEDKKVYFYNEWQQSMKLKYDFSLAANDTLKFLTDGSSPFIIGPKQTGGIEGFKGVYRDIRMCGDEGQSYHDTFWLEGVGCLRGPIRNPCDPIFGDPVPEFLMSCTVGEEVIYLNDAREDGATPEGVRKKRFDFTHTIKIQPKSRIRKGEEQSLYGEYNDQQLGIHLDPLDDDYLVSITDEFGKTVYEKAVNAGNIVGLNIDISAYSKGSYTVTIENNNEVFTGEFGTETTGIQELKNSRIEKLKSIYNLQGQRLNSLQKGLNIVNGQKVYVK